MLPGATALRLVTGPLSLQTMCHVAPPSEVSWMVLGPSVFVGSATICPATTPRVALRKATAVGCRVGVVTSAVAGVALEDGEVAGWEPPACGAMLQAAIPTAARATAARVIVATSMQR